MQKAKKEYPLQTISLKRERPIPRGGDRYRSKAQKPDEEEVCFSPSRHDVGPCQFEDCKFSHACQRCGGDHDLQSCEVADEESEGEAGAAVEESE